ncbi:hypothetical protein BON22_4206 [Cyberlindnera fabianii]|uniref:37S ribosomal protein PET123, mitochondrial n=1 Tax=Cyberlindnera fabianii TaxID=36022 RepID=A0A1V2L1V9_CYBFA|nr:hypothetical protein BON22_4206 [Cyberlindnera fabianii]
MGKGAFKFGGKSGVLPEVRQIFKHPIKPVVRPANKNVGYADGVQHPKGTSREQPLPKVVNIETLIKGTMKEPENIPDLQKAGAVQKEKVSKAALRRKYYVDALHKEENRLDLQEKRQAQKVAADAKRKAESKYEMSQATKLTLPTISKLLEGPLMRERTEEEKEILAAKRKANRLQNELKGKENRAVDLLSLYYSAEKFITTEEELQYAVDAAFENQAIISDPEMANRSQNSLLKDAIFGTINGKPGLPDIEDEISGAAKDFREQLDELAKKEIAQKRDRELNNTVQ